MKFLKKLALKNLKLNRKRTIVTIIGVILSVALITTVADMYMTGVNSIIEMEKNIKGNFHVAVKAVDYEDLSYIENNRQLSDYAYVKSLGFAKIENAKVSERPYINVSTFSKDDVDILRIKMKSGDFPKNENEIMVPEGYKEDGYDIKVGDTISLDLGQRIGEDGKSIDYNAELTSDEDGNKKSEQIINTSKKEYKVTGIYKTVSNYIQVYGAAGYTFFNISNAGRVDIGEGDKVDVYLNFKQKYLGQSYKTMASILGIKEKSVKICTTSHNVSDYTKTEYEEAEKDFENSKYYIELNDYLIKMEMDPLKATGVDTIEIFAIIISAIVVVSSVFCIKNSFDISVTEKIKQYGMLRSIGATKAQLRLNVFYEAYVIGIIGIPLGLLLGIFASYVLTLITNYLMPENLFDGVKLTFIVSIPAILIAVVLAVVTIIVSSLGSARKAAKISPIDSIRNSGNIKIKAKKLKVPFFVRKLFGIGGEISYKNLKRNKKKYRTTVIAMVITIICFIILNSIVSLLYRSLDEEVGNSKYNINGNISYSDKNLEGIHGLEKLEGVNNVDYAIDLTIDEIDISCMNKKYIEANDYLDEKTIEDNGVNCIAVQAMDNNTFKEYADKIGANYNQLKDAAIYLDGYESYAYDEAKDEYNEVKVNKFVYKKGDVCKGKFYVGYDEEKQESIYEDVEVNINAYTEIEPEFNKIEHSSEPTLIMSEDYFKKAFASSEKNFTVYFYLETDGTNNTDKLVDDYFENYSDKNVYNNNKQVKTIKNLLIIISIFLYGFIIVVTLIGVTSIFNTITTSVTLRAQEFAMLKSVGMTKKEFKRMIRLESIFMGMKSLFYGLILGVGASFVIYKILGGDMNYGRYAIPYSGIAISIVAVIFIISIIMGYAVRKNEKQNIIETIRNENI